MSRLNHRQKRFVVEYAKHGIAARAARDAGYSRKTARTMGHELLTKPDIRAAVAAQQGKVLAKAEVTATQVLEELCRLAFADPRAMFDEDGNLRPIVELTRDEAALIASFEVVKKNAEAGDGITDTVHKLKVWDKPAALALLAKHFGLLKERIQVEGGIQISWQE
jgi:phage terminase small subunit